MAVLAVTMCEKPTIRMGYEAIFIDTTPPVCYTSGESIG